MAFTIDGSAIQCQVMFSSGRGPPDAPWRRSERSGRCPAGGGGRWNGSRTGYGTRRGGLHPAGSCLAFAEDCMGNLFFFQGLPASPPRPDDAAVWVFDHDEDRAVQQAASFDEWLGRLLRL